MLLIRPGFTLISPRLFGNRFLVTTDYARNSNFSDWRSQCFGAELGPGKTHSPGWYYIY